ncbi:RHEB like 1 S homeolog isoform X1 [Xenopus laevis]|uniref:small monomeric GTPase n=1 Tax=Xenopus laevis TaxID=8355 RepID=A0A8J0UIL7_XENLA|nr:RHEB like 1 S homeolog isoform X1 [Xenopus laevis]
MSLPLRTLGARPLLWGAMSLSWMWLTLQGRMNTLCFLSHSSLGSMDTLLFTQWHAPEASRLPVPFIAFLWTSGESVCKNTHIFFELTSFKTPFGMPIVLVGNKNDLPTHCREVKPEDGKKLAESWGAAFLEVSAKDPERSKLIFTKMIEEIDRVERSFDEEKKCCVM